MLYLKDVTHLWVDLNYYTPTCLAKGVNATGNICGMLDCDAGGWGLTPKHVIFNIVTIRGSHQDLSGLD